MVRLSLIVLGLLAAAWCFTGAAEGMRVTRNGNRPHLICGAYATIKVECYGISPSCSGPTITSDSAKCINSITVNYVKKCGGRSWCRFYRGFKGPNTCKYRCVKRKKVCTGPRWQRRCRYY